MPTDSKKSKKFSLASGNLSDWVKTSIDLQDDEAPDEFAKNELNEPAHLVDGIPQKINGLVNLFKDTKSWRACHSIIKLREQINKKAPNRNRGSDGTIGDPAHRTRKSDHNPWIIDSDFGVVTALDITYDLAEGCDCEKVVEILRNNRDERIKYVIWNRRIFNSQPIGGSEPWAWRSYGGSNPHSKHFHISVKSEKSLYDLKKDWSIEPWD